MPVLKYADNRSLREKMYVANASKACKGDERDNQEILKRIVELRLKLANLLGYKTFADFALDRRMAKTANRVFQFLDELHEASKPVAMT